MVVVVEVFELVGILVVDLACFGVIFGIGVGGFEMFEE